MPSINFLQKVLHTITSCQMLKPNDSILVAVSGGPDSVALLRSLMMLAPENGWGLGVAHVNHNLRTDAATEEAFVVSMAKELTLPSYSKKANVRAYQKKHKLSLEEAAREVRHRILFQTAAAHGYNKIALGHHANDNAELILMNLLRGSGPEGLAGMPFQRLVPLDRVDKDAIHLIRPLIQCNRKEIDTFLKAQHFHFVLDESNSELCFRRNRIRHELIPHIREAYNPNIVDTLNRMANVIDSEVTWMTEMATPVLKDAILKQTERTITLSLSKISAVPLAMKRRIFRSAISSVKGNLRKVTFTHIDAIMRLLRKGPEAGQLDLPDRIRVTREKDRLIFSQEKTPLRNLPKKPLHKGNEFEHLLKGPGTYYLENLNLEITVTVYNAKNQPNTLNAGHKVAFFDMNTVTFPLTIRNVKSGDRFMPLGMAGTQKINKFFKDRKIPANERGHCPLLLSQGRVVWVMGHRLDDSAKIIPDTQCILKVAFDLLDKQS